MIHVQIASDITASGVEGVRWVLLEPGENLAPAASAPPLAAAGPATAARAAAGSMPQWPAWPAAPARAGLRLETWQWVFAGLGLVLMMGLARLPTGAAKVPAPGAAATSGPGAHAALPKAPAMPAAASAAAELAAVAPAASTVRLERLTTAEH